MSKGIIILNEIPEKCDQCLVRHPGLAYCQIASEREEKAELVPDQADAGGD